jgi:hypothetical protein
MTIRGTCPVSTSFDVREAVSPELRPCLQLELSSGRQKPLVETQQPRGMEPFHLCHGRFCVHSSPYHIQSRISTWKIYRKNPGTSITEYLPITAQRGNLG